MKRTFPTETPFELPNYPAASFISAHRRENCYSPCNYVALVNHISLDRSCTLRNKLEHRSGTRRDETREEISPNITRALSYWLIKGRETGWNNASNSLTFPRNRVTHNDWKVAKVFETVCISFCRINGKFSRIFNKYLKKAIRCRYQWYSTPLIPMRFYVNQRTSND